MPSKQAWTNKVEGIYHAQIERQRTHWEQLDTQTTHHSYHEDDDDSVREGVRKMHEVLADKAGIDEDTDVLNVGCGGGGAAVWIADTYGASVVGVDATQKFVESAQDHASERGVEDLCEFRYEDFHELSSVPDDSVDVVWALQSIHHAYDYEQVLEQVHRVLADGGTFVVADFFRRPGDLDEAERERFDFFDDATQAKTIPVDRFKSMLESAGFERVDSGEHTENVTPFEKRLYWISLFTYPYTKVKSLLGLASQANVDEAKSIYDGYKLIKSGARQFHIVKAEL